MTGSINHSDSLDLDFYSSSEDVPTIVVIEKADKNPNAGKTVMELYVPDGYVNEKIADAINKFNTTNSDY